MTVKNLSHIKINSVNPLYLTTDQIGNKYLTLVPTDESKETKNKEIWNKFRDLIRSITKKSDNYDEKYMKIKFNSDDNLTLKKTQASQHGNSC